MDLIATALRSYIISPDTQGKRLSIRCPTDETTSRMHVLLPVIFALPPKILFAPRRASCSHIVVDITCLYTAVDISTTNDSDK